MIGAAANLAFLNEQILGVDFGWRLGLQLGPFLDLLIMPMQRHIPESPLAAALMASGAHGRRGTDGLVLRRGD